MLNSALSGQRLVPTRVFEGSQLYPRSENSFKETVTFHYSGVYHKVDEGAWELHGKCMARNCFGDRRKQSANRVASCILTRIP
jgi:hypothetical protein